MRFLSKYKYNSLYFLTVLLIIFIPLSGSFSQDKYDFNFNDEWDWYDLKLNDKCINSTILQGYIKVLMEEFSIEDGRILFRELTKLDNLTDVKNMVFIPHLEDDPYQISWRANLDTNLAGFNEFNTFDGLITTAYKLSKFHIKDYFTGGFFKKRRFYENVIPSHSLKINLEIEYFPANFFLNLFDNSKISDSELEVVDSSEVIRSFYDSLHNPGMDHEKYLNFISFAKNKEPLIQIFKVLNPISVRVMGGVSLYTQDFRRVLNTITRYEKNIRDEALYILSIFLPDSLSFDTKAYFSFGNFNDTLNNRDNEFVIRLEECGDDYEKVSKLLARGVFKVLRDDIEININNYIVKGEDSLLLSILDDIYYTSCINYIASEFKEDLPSALLEKDFLFFNKSMDKILKNEDTTGLDSLFKIGFSGNALYYTMGMQVANYIDRFAGKKNLRNAITLGPIYFYDCYIDMYEQNSERIRNVFTFYDDFESKIREWSKITNYDMHKEVLNIQQYHTDSSRFFKEISNLNEKYKNDYFVFNLLIGQMLYKFEYYTESLKYFRRALPYTPNKGALKYKIAEIENYLKSTGE